MIVDFVQKKDLIEISVVNDNGEIVLEQAPLDNGYYKYVECEDFDLNKIPNLTSFRGSSIKREPIKYFSHHNINEFFNYDLKLNQPSIYEKIVQLNIPNPYSLDIETDITDEFGYSNQFLAENKILSISFTDENLNSIIFELKDPRMKELTDVDHAYIRSILMDSLGPEHRDRFAYDYKTRYFDTEIEMIETFLECINKYFHSVIGWNFLSFDWIYITNRCLRLGIPLKKASPTFHLSNKSIKVKKNESITIQVPTHRIIADYMIMFKQSLIYNNLPSYSLNNIAELILGLKKVMYEGNLRTLYETNFPKFVAYSLIDTILVMLIHKATNLYNVDFFESYYNGISYSKISQNAISEALIYNELRLDNIFLLESEKNIVEKRNYKGGFVKTPTRKNISAGAGLDFSALYPNAINTGGLSPELKVDKIFVNEFGYPKTKEDLQIWLSYKAMNYTLSPEGTIYDKNKEGLFPRIEKKLQKSRAVFKGHGEDIYLNIIPQLEKRIKELEQSQS